MLRLCQNETLKQCAIALAFPTHGFSEQQYFSTINELILIGNMVWLYQQLRDDSGLIYAVNVDSSFIMNQVLFVFCSVVWKIK